jgi:hypothetical protein
MSDTARHLAESPATTIPDPTVRDASELDSTFEGAAMRDAAPDRAPRRPLSPEAQRALAEAAERRARANVAPRPAELGGRDGPEPVRYGDWEIKGIACDF